jgi:hypothetical protein
MLYYITLYNITYIMELVILNQSYTEWLWQNPLTKEVDKDIMITPSQHHLFHGDIYDDITEELVIPSLFRTKKDIPCILDYKGSTHGRSKDKLFYRCIPDDKTLPQFLVAYQSKTTGFDKNKINKYVLIQLKEWPADEKHPIGTLTNTLGDVDNYDAYCEYQLYSRGLVISLKEFIKETVFLKNKKVEDSLIDGICDQYPSIENRTHLNIFSIDPEGCTDIDDAIGITQSSTYTTISVYIANVPLILDYFNLWQHLSEKCSTIYLPMHKLPMLPPILSDNICSLLQDELRFAFVMDIKILSVLPEITFKPALIKVGKNYVYEETDLLANTDYQHLLKITQKNIDKPIIDSHDIVEYYMIYMNQQSAMELVKHNCGILRSAHVKPAHVKPAHVTNEKLNSLPIDVNNFITNWKYASGQYCNIENKSSHDLIGKGFEVYTHITSPIRRLVDIINMTLLQHKLGFNSRGITFCQQWTTTEKVEFINTSMKSIKKVQNNCNLLALYIKNKDAKKKQAVIGYIVDMTVDNKKHKYTYNVYIPDYKMISSFKSNDIIDVYTSQRFTLHLFMNEANLKQKIRLQKV